jgi:hypothetical protein
MKTTTTVPTPQPTGTGTETSEGFAKKVAGSYLVRIDLPTGATGTSLLKLQADGSVSHCDQSDFGFGDPARFGFASPAYGSWRKVGSRELAGFSVNMAFDDQGAPHHFSRWTTKVSFTENFNGFSGESLTENFAFDVDPLDPSASPLGKPMVAQFTGRRIEAR